MNIEKCIIVEGRSDLLKIKKLIVEPVCILCTHGTKDEEALVELLEPYEEYDFYTFFDRDYAGNYLRQMMRRAYSEATQLQLPEPYIGVAEAPVDVLRKVLATKFVVK